MWKPVGLLVIGLIAAAAIDSLIAAVIFGSLAVAWAIAWVGEQAARSRRAQAEPAPPQQVTAVRDEGLSERMRAEHSEGWHDNRRPGERIKGCPTCKEIWLRRRRDEAERLRTQHIEGKHDDRPLGDRVKGCPACKETWLVTRHSDGHHQGRFVKGCFACRNRANAANPDRIQEGRFD